MVGGCDLYTTKAAGADKKLYKTIEQTLESQYASLLSFSAGLSASQAVAAAGAVNLSRASPFGSLSQPSSRRTFAYLIATLNASHPDYDFSHLLRPADFRREKSLKRVLNTLDTTLYNLRPRPSSSFLLSTGSPWSSSISNSVPPPSPGKEVWNPRMWRLIDKEMSLKECSIYCYAPEEDPYDGEEGAIWSFNYFFFNKARKRVCYIYLRGLSIIGHSPAQKTPMKLKRSAEIDWNQDEPPSSKRARYWLGDRAAEATSEWADEDDEYGIQHNEDLLQNDNLDNDKEAQLVTTNEPHPEIAFSADEAASPSAVSLSAATPSSTERSRSKSAIRAASSDAMDSPNV